MDIEECLPLNRDSVLVRCVVRVLARKPGATLILLAFSCVLVLPLLVHYLLMLLVSALIHVGLLHIKGEETLSWLISKGQLVSVLLMFTITSALMLGWYIGMKNIYTRYFRTERLEVLQEHHLKTH